jgi:uracil-DNA glycosylase
MNLVDRIHAWQEEAKAIAHPEGTDLKSARGGLHGPAFFPEGLGLEDTAAAELNWPKIMAIGHNFGCEQYRDEIDASGREDDKATWRSLRRLLLESGESIGNCYMTNWFIGLQPGSNQVGVFLRTASSRYESQCRALLLRQIEMLQPRVILLLGLEVVGRAHEAVPALQAWAGARSWISVDQSAIGPIAYDVEISGTGTRANVVALLQPSFAASNQRHRTGAFSQPKPEVQMLTRACATRSTTSDKLLGGVR